MAEQRKTAMEIGKSYMIRSVTHYYVGKLAEITDEEYVLENASWVADTGRFSDCLKEGNFSELEPFVDPVYVNRGGIIDKTLWNHDLPRERIPNKE